MILFERTSEGMGPTEAGARLRPWANPGGGSPTLFATDRDTDVVQGWKVPGRCDSVEIPARLLTHLLTGTALGVPLHGTEHDTFILSGAAITDPAALAQMDIPGHETCIEVAKVEETADGGVPRG